MTTETLRLPRAIDFTRGFLWIAAAYCLAHALLRVWASPNIGTDDVEQALFAQAWAWGYNPPQPPLFTWALMAAYALVGPGILAHALLKYALLFAVYGFAYATARRLIADRALAALASAALLLLSGFAWGVHAGFTHSVLLSAAIFATLLALLRVAERRRLGDYLWLGLAIGVGLLSKYSYGLFLLPLLAGALATSRWRPALLDRRLLATLALAALLFLPHGLWMAGLGRDYGAVLVNLAGIGAERSYLRNVGAGLASLAEATLLFLSPFWLIALVALWPALKPAGWRRAWQDPGVRLLALAAGIGVGFMLATVIFAEATYFKERRMHAVLLIVPLLSILIADRAGVTPRRLSWLAWAVGLVVVAAPVGVIAQGLFEPASCRNCRLHAPMPALAEALAAAGFERGTILAGDEHVGGNLRIRLGGAATGAGTRVLTPIYGHFRPALPAAAGRCLLVWNARERGDALPQPLIDLAQDLGAVPGAARFVDLPLLRAPGRLDRFGFAFADNADGACRPR